MPAGKQVGYAVIGMGALSQAAILPAFAHSKRAKIVALVTGDKEKGTSLAQQYKAQHVFSYEEFTRALQLPEIEAVYIVTPPGEHERYAVAAADAGKHVLCEKP